ncbi:MAG: hypothetical protein NTZ33_06165 [Bacteroidetes bacterium]|nr:hypothetical protein [Bacteroidota bacterium]
MRAKEIDRLVSKIMKVSMRNIRSKRGSFKVSEARYIAMYLRKKYLHQSYNSLAKEWAYSNHTVTRSGILNVSNHIETEKETAELIRLLELMVEQRLQKISGDKKRYNDHFCLKQNGHCIDAKQRILSISEISFNEIQGRDKKMMLRLVSKGYGIQLQINL